MLNRNGQLQKQKIKFLDKGYEINLYLNFAMKITKFMSIYFSFTYQNTTKKPEHL